MCDHGWAGMVKSTSLPAGKVRSTLAMVQTVQETNLISWSKFGYQYLDLRRAYVHCVPGCPVAGGSNWIARLPIDLDR